MRPSLPESKTPHTPSIGQKRAIFNKIAGRLRDKMGPALRSVWTLRALSVVLLLVLGWSVTCLTRLSTEYSVRQFYPQQHPLLVKDREIRKTFSLNEKAPYLFVVTLKKNQTWLEKSRVRRLQSFSKTIQEMDEVNQVLSLTAVEGAQQTSTELMVGNIFDRVPQSQWKKSILANPLLYPLLVTSDFKSTLILIEPKVIKTQELVAFHDKMRALVQAQFPEAQVLSAGVPLIQTRLSTMIRSEMTQILGAAILIFCALFYFLFSHWTAIVCAFTSLATANIFAIALLVAFDVPMNVVLVTLPIIVSVTVMSLLIHTLHLWSQKKRDAALRTRWAQALETFSELCLPNFLGAFTTALGFLALAPSHIPMIQQYGWVVAVVISLVCLFSQLMILLSLPFVQARMRRWFDKPAHWALFPVNNSKKVFITLVCFSIVGAGLCSRLNFSGRLFDDLPRGDGVRASMEWIDQVFGGIVSYELIAHSEREGFWKEPENLKNIGRVAEHLRLHPSVGSVVTISDFFQGGIPKNKGPVAETFFLFSMAEKNPLSNILTEDSRDLRITIRLKDQPTAQVAATKKWIQQSFRAGFPQLQVSEGGMASYAHIINQDVSRELVFGFWQSLLLIGVFLVFMLRSVKWALLACLPNFIPPAVLMGALAISQVPIKPGIALIFSIALGFAFNNTVYLLSRMRSLVGRVEDPLQEALLMEANPCFFESLVMFVGFSIFLLSDFSMNRTFGAFMMISILAGFFGDLFFLPALLKISARRSKPTPPSDLQPIELDEMGLAGELSAAAPFAAAIALLILVGSPAQGAPTALSAASVLKKSQAQLEAKDDQAKVEMKIIEKNGETKTRVLELKSLRGKGFSVLAKIQSPADIKGMGFLGHVDRGEESQWIYLPSSGQVRRVVAGKTKAGLLGSEISPEDLNSQAIKSSSSRLAQQDAQFYWIEITPAKGTSAYSRVVTKISKKDFLPYLTEYYIQNKMKKSVEFKDYTKVGSVYRAQMIDVKNHFNGRGTQIKISKLKLNSGLTAQDFSQSALKD